MLLVFSVLEEALGKVWLSYRLNIWQSKPLRYSTYSRRNKEDLFYS